MGGPRHPARPFIPHDFTERAFGSDWKSEPESETDQNIVGGNTRRSIENTKQENDREGREMLEGVGEEIEHWSELQYRGGCKSACIKEKKE